MDKELQDALRVKAILKTPAWQVIEELLDAALVLIQEDALDDKTSDVCKFFEARGARRLAKSFKAALHAAASVTEEENVAATSFGS
jgi:hypothetical protein